MANAIAGKELTGQVSGLPKGTHGHSGGYGEQIW